MPCIVSYRIVSYRIVRLVYRYSPNAYNPGLKGSCQKPVCSWIVRLLDLEYSPQTHLQYTMSLWKSLNLLWNCPKEGSCAQFTHKAKMQWLKGKRHYQTPLNPGSDSGESFGPLKRRHAVAAEPSSRTKNLREDAENRSSLIIKSKSADELCACVHAVLASWAFIISLALL